MFQLERATKVSVFMAAEGRGTPMRKLAPSRAIAGDTYYVIIGCGVTAAVNYTTLLAAPYDPFGGYEVLFIGEPEPWGEYNPLPMGQWPSILAPPSFKSQLVPPLPQDDFVPSAEFSTGIDDQWAWLYHKQPFRYSPGLVTSINRHPAGHGFEVIWEENGSTYKVHAAHLDICGGPGPSRRLCRNQVDPKLWPYPNPTSLLLQTGESYLSKTASLAQPGERVAVIGGGPTAAWCVERALHNKNRVLWVADRELNPAFVSSRRNDELARSLTRVHKNRRNSVAYSVFPNSPDLVFAEFYKVSYVHHGGNTVEVDFTPLARDRHVDGNGSLQPLGRESFAQAILALGQESGYQAPCKHATGCPLTCEAKSWATRLDAIFPDPWPGGVARPVVAWRRHLIVRDGMEVGLRSDDGKLRVLGGAFLTHRYAREVFKDINSELFRYMASLTEQAQVENGAAMATMTTAMANDYFSYPPNYNHNRNSATLNQLKALFGLAPQHAELLHDARKYRIHPVTNDEAHEVHHATRDRC
jgi:hypothetical protein